MPELIIPPPIQPIETITFPLVEKASLTNGIPVHLIRDDSNPVLRLDFMFGCGVWQQSKPLISSFTNEMLREGSRSLSSQKIAEQLDFYGSWLSLSASYHNSYLTVYCLNKYLPQTLAVIESMLKESIFPPSEFETLRAKRKQRYLLDQQKVQVLANTRFAECIYGIEHPYAKTASEKDFDTITADALLNFYQKQYHAGNCQLIISGKIDKTALDEIETRFGKNDWKKNIEKENSKHTMNPASEKKHFIEKSNTVQAAIKIGRAGVTRKADDYCPLRVLTTVLGGYFGSRLMSSIREEKGYTYGIGASLGSLRDAGSFSISTQAANEYVEPLISEVYAQMQKLCDEPIEAEELSLVKNVMLGDMARAFDSTFSVADSYISLLANDSTFNLHKKQLSVIKNITPKEIQQLAQKYFVPNEFYEVVAG